MLRATGVADVPMEAILTYSDALFAVFCTVGAIPLASLSEEDQHKEGGAGEVIGENFGKVLLFLTTFMLVRGAWSKNVEVVQRFQFLSRGADFSLLFSLLCVSLMPVTSIFSSQFSQKSVAAEVALFVLRLGSEFFTAIAIYVGASALRPGENMPFLVTKSVLQMVGSIIVILTSAMAPFTLPVVLWTVIKRGIDVVVEGIFSRLVLRRVFGAEWATLHAQDKESKSWRDCEQSYRVRFEAIADGVFGIAATLTLLDIDPGVTEEDGVDPFFAFLFERRQDLTVFATSFILLWIQWKQHRQVLATLTHINSFLTFLDDVSLFAAAINPFCIALLVAYPNDPIAAISFLFALSLGGLARSLMFLYGAFWAYVPPDNVRPIHVKDFAEEEGGAGEEGRSGSVAGDREGLVGASALATRGSMSVVNPLDTGGAGSPRSSAAAEIAAPPTDHDPHVRPDGVHLHHSLRNILLSRMLIYPILGPLGMAFAPLSAMAGLVFGYASVLVIVPLVKMNASLLKGETIADLTRTLFCWGPASRFSPRGTAPCACFRYLERRIPPKTD